LAADVPILSNENNMKTITKTLAMNFKSVNASGTTPDNAAGPILIGLDGSCAAELSEFVDDTLPLDGAKFNFVFDKPASDRLRSLSYARVFRRGSLLAFAGKTIPWSQI
jgi:hypothetical protein